MLQVAVSDLQVQASDIVGAMTIDAAAKAAVEAA
jgi:hypothetical protein